MKKKLLVIFLIPIIILIFTVNFFFEKKDEKQDVTDYSYIAMTIEGTNTQNPPSTGFYYINTTCTGMNLLWDSAKRKFIASGTSSSESVVSCKIDFRELNIVMDLDGEIITTIPEDDKYILSSYNCDGATITYDNSLSIIVTSAPSTCTISFTRDNVKKAIISAETPKSDASVNFANNSSTNGDAGLYYTADAETYGEDGKRIYYYRGDIDNNWVSFGGYYWRIVRTTAEGGVKLVYSGGNPATGTSSLSTSSGLIGASAFNSTSNSKYYVGYTYNTSSYTGTQTNSNAKTQIDNWYIASTLTATDRTYLSETAIYCNDKSSEKISTHIWYPVYFRLTTTNHPTYVCNKTNESRYTVKRNEINGDNGYLTYPVAMLSADEIYYAGLVYYNKVATITSYIMDNVTNARWWTMSPTDFWENNGAFVLNVLTSGSLQANDYVNLNSVKLRPSVSLKSCIKVAGGNGSKETPYTLSNVNC